MSDNGGVSRWVLIRDLFIFQFKLSLDSVKGLLLAPVALAAAMFGILFGGRTRGRLFYRVLASTERFDLWLNLFCEARKAGSSSDGLLGASEAGSDNLLGQLEQQVRGGDQPRTRLPRIQLSNPFSPDSMRHFERPARPKAAPAGYLPEPAGYLPEPATVTVTSSSAVAELT